MQRSTMEAMTCELSNNSRSVAFKNIASESGGVMGTQNPGQLPRSRQQLYDLKFKMNKSDEVDKLLLYSKQKDETVGLEHHDVPEDLWILGKPHMCQDLSRSCTSDSLSHPYSVDPTFNFGKFEVTPFLIPKKCRPRVGQLLADCRLPPFTKIFCQQSADCWQHVGSMSVNCWPSVG